MTVRRRLRVPGHRLTLEWSGEYGAESSSTATCACGWQEHAGSQEICREEYRWHLMREIARRDGLSLQDVREQYG